MLSGKYIWRGFQKAALFIVAAVSTTVFLSHDSDANSRYGTKPPVILSPDLTEPWQLQVTGQRKARIVVRSNKSRAFYTPQKKVRKKKRVRNAALSQQHQKSVRNRSLPSRFLPQIVEYHTTEKPGTIVIDTKSKFLYLVLKNGEARRYGVGVGREGFGWTGSERVTRKAEWPSWRPPLEMIERERKKGRILPRYMPGGIENPMGARALYLGSTLYRIHGTNAPWTIGQNVSSGCFRMRNEDVTDLYPRVGIGAKVVVI